MGNITDKDYDLVSNMLDKHAYEEKIKRFFSEADVEYVPVTKQKEVRKRSNAKDKLRKTALTCSAIALLLGGIVGYEAKPYIDAAATISHNNTMIGSMMDHYANNGGYLTSLKFKYNVPDDLSIFQDPELYRTIDLEDSESKNAAKDYIEGFNEEVKEATNGEKSYVDALYENKEAREQFGKKTDSLGEVLGVEIEQIFTEQELENMRVHDLTKGGK